MLAANLIRNLLGLYANWAYMILALVGGMTLSFAVLVALALAVKMVDGQDEVKRVFG